MCGIAGEFIFDPRGRVEQSSIVPMVSALQVKKRPFVAASSETLGLNRNSEFSTHYLDSRAIRNPGLFNQRVVGSLRRSLDYLPRGSRVLAWRRPC